MKTTRKIGVVTALLVSVALGANAQTTSLAKADGGGLSARTDISGFSEMRYFSQPRISGTNSTGTYNKEFRLSVGPDFGVPVGDLSNSYNWSAGGSVQAEIPVIPNLYVTVNAGYRGIFSKTGNEFASGQDLQTIPLKAGLRYYFLDNLLYVQGQAGATILANKSNAQADKSAGFSYAPQVGVLIRLAPKNYLDAGVYWEQTQSFYNNGSGTMNLLGLRLAYTFGL